VSVLSRHVDAMVVALTWKRTVVIEQGRWLARSTAWKPHGENVRNLRMVQRMEADLVAERNRRRSTRPGMPKDRSGVLSEHTRFEYEEFEWRKYRSFSAKGDSPADLRWPEYTLEPDQRISERRETYHAKFSSNADANANEYLTELDQATWRTLKVGKRYRLTVGLLSDEVKQVAPTRDGTHR
jgi:hypothetical protein